MHVASLISRGFGRPSVPLFAALLLAMASVPQDVAAQSETVLQNIRLGSDTMTYEAPRLLVRGSPLPETELRRLLDPASPEPWAERVARIEAEEILAPELIATIKLPQLDQRTTYRDVSLKKIGRGRIESLTSSIGAMEGTQAGRKVTGSNGAISIRDLDVGGAIALMSAKATPGEALKRIYGSFLVEAIKVIDSAGVTTEVARMSGSDLSAKPTALGWTGTLNAIAALEKDAGPSGAAKAMDALAELFESIAVGTVEATGIAMNGKSEKDDIDLAISMKRVAYVSAASGRPAEFRVEGSDFRFDDARISYGTMVFGGLDAKPALEALREISLNPENPSPAVVRKLLPIISTIRVENIDVDTPAGEGKGGKGKKATPGERVRFGLGRFEVNAEKPVNGIPSDLRIQVRNLGFPIPANPSDENFAMLSQLGYDRLEGSLGIDLGWNETGQELLLRNLSLDGKDMGSAVIRAVIGKVGRDVFDTDTAVASVAFMSASAKSLDLVVDDRGLFQKIIAREARRQKRPPEDVRREYGMAASIGIPAILGNSNSAKALAQAVSRFVAKPGKLTIQARAKRSSGFGIADYMANPSPGGVLDAVDITASAE